MGPKTDPYRILKFLSFEFGLVALGLEALEFESLGVYQRSSGLERCSLFGPSGQCPTLNPKP